MKTIRIFDTTLRDGEQSPGCSMNTREKVEIARQLEKLGIDIIEAGFAIASPGDFESVSEVAKTVKNTRVCSLARALEKDIDAAANAVKAANYPYIHTFLATSDIHLNYKLKMTKDQALERIAASVSYAKKFCDEVEFSAEDATRSDRDFLVKALSVAVKAGATTINVPDTVGYIMPEEMAALITYVLENVKGIDKTILSVHCHNDLGLAVANSLAAVRAGATQVEGTINGIGERAGNASIEEIAMALYTRKNEYNTEVNINTKEIFKTSKLLQLVTGVPVQPNKAIVGKNAFAHESGIHQHGMLNNPLTYEIISPEIIGINKINLVLGKHSGKHAFESKLKELGYNEITPEILENLFEQFKILADKKKEILEDDIEALMLKGKINLEKHIYKLNKFLITCGNSNTNIATVALTKEGEVIESVSIGDGPIDAAFKAIEKNIGLHFSLEDFYITAVTGGKDAQGTAKVRLGYGDKYITAVGISTDIIEASILAYLNAANELLTIIDAGL